MPLADTQAGTRGMTGMTLDDTAPMTGLLLSRHLGETPTSRCKSQSQKARDDGQAPERSAQLRASLARPAQQAFWPLTAQLPGTGLLPWPRLDLRAGAPVGHPPVLRHMCSCAQDR